MANLILVTPEELRERANDVRRCRVLSDQAVLNINGLVQGLNEIWTGEAQQAFESKLHALQARFDEFSNEMGVYANKMDFAANELENIDKRLSQTISNFQI